MEWSLWFNRHTLAVWRVVGSWSPVEFVLVMTTTLLVAGLVATWCFDLRAYLRRRKVCHD